MLRPLTLTGVAPKRLHNAIGSVCPRKPIHSYMRTAVAPSGGSLKRRDNSYYPYS